MDSAIDILFQTPVEFEMRDCLETTWLQARNILVEQLPHYWQQPFCPQSTTIYPHQGMSFMLSSLATVLYLKNKKYRDQACEEQLLLMWLEDTAATMTRWLLQSWVCSIFSSIFHLKFIVDLGNTDRRTWLKISALSCNESKQFGEQ